MTTSPIVTSDEIREEQLLATIAQAEASLAEIRAKRERRASSQVQLQGALASVERLEHSTLSSCQPFSFEKPASPIRMLGWEIRYRTDEDCWQRQKSHGWAKEGELPKEWTEICADPTTVSAVIFRSYMRDWRADRRQHAATYERQAVIA